MTEEWKPIPDYEGLYEVSSLGNIRSLDRFMYSKRWNKESLIKGRILKPTLYKNGYLRVELTDKDGNRKNIQYINQSQMLLYLILIIIHK